MYLKLIELTGMIYIWLQKVIEKYLIDKRTYHI